MNRVEFLVMTVLSAAALIVVVAVIASSFSVRRLAQNTNEQRQEIAAEQQRLLSQQQTIRQGYSVQQKVQGILVDMARVGVENEQMRDLLASHGFQINFKPPQSQDIP